MSVHTVIPVLCMKLPISLPLSLLPLPQLVNLFDTDTRRHTLIPLGCTVIEGGQTGADQKLDLFAERVVLEAQLLQFLANGNELSLCVRHLALALVQQRLQAARGEYVSKGLVRVGDHKQTDTHNKHT